MSAVTSSRRGLFGAAAALSLAALPAVALASTGGDDALLSACQAFSVYATQVEAWDADEIDLTDVDSSALMDRWHEELERVIELPARTPAGVRAKALVAFRAMQSVEGSAFGAEERAAIAALADAAGIGPSGYVVEG